MIQLTRRWMTVATALSLAWSAQAADWSQFLGPSRDGIAHDAKGLPRSWSGGGPKVMWKIPVGAGYAGAAIYGDSVLLLDREGTEADVLRRFRLADGKEIWHYRYEAPGRLPSHGSRTTPATDGKLVFTVGPFGHVRAAKFDDGSVAWQGNLFDDWQIKSPPNWGIAQSPLLYNDLVILSPWGQKAAVVAYEKQTGKVRWTSPNVFGIGPDYESPMPMKIHGVDMIVCAGKNGKTVAVAPDSGKVLWQYDGYNCRIHIPPPIQVAPDKVYLTGGYDAGSVMIQIDKAGAGFKVRELWRDPKLGSQIATPVVQDGFIYANVVENGRPKLKGRGLLCFDINGKVQWETDPGKFGRGNMILADGLILIESGQKGDLVMVEASPKGYRELGRAQIVHGSRSWAPLAYSNGKLVFRSQTELACVDLLAR